MDTSVSNNVETEIDYINFNKINSEFNINMRGIKKQILFPVLGVIFVSLLAAV